MPHAGASEGETRYGMGCFPYCASVGVMRGAWYERQRRDMVSPCDVRSRPR